MNYQKVVVAGRVGRDPEARQAGSTEVANFSVATSEKRKGAEVTTWFNVVTFGKTAEIAMAYVRKGSEVLVEGRLQTREWNDRDTGQKRQAWELVCDRLVLGAKPQGDRQPQGERQPIGNGAEIARKAYANASTGGAFSDMDDDVPW